MPQVHSQQLPINELEKYWDLACDFLRTQSRTSTSFKVRVQRYYLGRKHAITRSNTAHHAFFWNVAFDLLVDAATEKQISQSAFKEMKKHLKPYLPGVDWCLPQFPGESSGPLYNGRSWDCFVKPVPPPEHVQVALSHVCLTCQKSVSSAIHQTCDGKCRDCFQFKCSACEKAISKTSHERLDGLCWVHFLAVPSCKIGLPCKNVSAAHVACPNRLSLESSGLYCDTCKNDIQPSNKRYCRNRSSLYRPCQAFGQSGAHGFCKVCTGEEAFARTL